MKIKFDHNLDFQNDAIESIVDIFEGQPKKNGTFTVENYAAQQRITEIDSGISNNILLSKESIKKNVQSIQLKNGLEQIHEIEDLDFTIDMETGTGKTYVYLKTIMELNKEYGFTKFIIVVPSLAIKEGVYKSLEITKSGFNDLYDNEPYEYFDYDSDNIEQVRSFVTSNNIQIMIINIQAFNRNFTKKGMGNIMHRENDRLSGNKPRELIGQTNPITIIDEPQSTMSTNNAKKAIKSLNPSMIIRYSATHREKINTMYKLDAIDAYQKKLVKQIEVASIEGKDDHNTPYIKLISVNNKKSPITAQVEIDVMDKGNLKTKKVTVKQSDDLFDKTNGRDIYSGYIINDIYCEKGNEYIDFTSQRDIIRLGDSIGGIDDDIIKRAQIRKTIEEHLEKELRLNEQGVKVLSLFFIDRVKNYRIYNKDGTTSSGKYAKWFEEEYRELIRRPKYKKIIAEDTDITDHISASHNGYFSKDNKGRIKDSKTGNAKHDEDTYSLIMKDKEKLLNFNSKLRFIFSHSALKEGWDNPNIFQICTLNETTSVIKKRQEIGRGLRLAVNQNGERTEGFEINTLTVMANESYEDFAKSLQHEYEKDAGVKFGFIKKHSFSNIKEEREGQEEFIGEFKSEKIYEFLKSKEYIDEDGEVTKRLRVELKENLFEVPEEFIDLEIEIKNVLEKMISTLNIKNADDKKIVKPNKERILSPEFKELWENIKYKTNYSVSVDSDELIKLCSDDMKNNLRIDRAKLYYTKANTDLSEAGITIKETAANTEVIDTVYENLPDIITSLQNDTDLTRSTIAKILNESDTFDKFKTNPQKYIEEVTKIINLNKRLLLVDGIKYTKIFDESYSYQELFINKELTGYLSKNLYKAERATHEYIVYDSQVELTFAEKFETDSKVKLYAKLPSQFKIKTPLGKYNPDWAVLIENNNEEKLYFVIESKGSIAKGDLRPIEREKIKCAKKHFKSLNTEVVFEEHDDVNEFLNNL